jgi:hypothetical protein
MIQIVALLVGALGPMLMSVAGRVLVAVGIGVVTYAGVDVALTALKTSAFNNFVGLPATVLTVLYVTKVDLAINIIFSALLGNIAMRGLSSAITKFVHKAPV